MTDRIGVCVGCGSRFKVPPTFQGRSATCRKCGKTVSIRDASSAERVANAKQATRKAASQAAHKAVSGATPRPVPTPLPTPKATRIEDPQTATTVGFVLGAILVLGGGGYYVWHTVKQASAYDYDDEAASAEGDRERIKTITDSRSTPSTVGEGQVPSRSDGTEASPTPPAASREERGARESQPLPPAPRPTRIAFSHYVRPAICSTEIWSDLESTVRKAYLEEATESARHAARAQLASDRFGNDRIAAICVMINGLDGLELADAKQAPIAWDLVEAVQSISLDVIRLPPRSTTGDPTANAQYAARVVAELTRYWSDQLAAPARFERDLASALERAKRQDF